MISTDEDALICDFAEVYHIYDYKALPVKYAATLACGLREDSRISMALQGQKYDLDTVFKVLALDYLSLIWWSKTKEAQEGKGKPASIYARLMGGDIEDNGEIRAFDSGEEFMAKREEILRRNEAG